MYTKQIIKCILLTALFYLLLVFNVFHIGEKLLPTTKDYLENAREETKENTGHASASDNLTSLCETNTICNKITFNGKYTTTNKYLYTKAITDIIGFIDDNTTQEKNIEDTINNITINNQNGTRR